MMVLYRRKITVTMLVMLTFFWIFMVGVHADSNKTTQKQTLTTTNITKVSKTIKETSNDKDLSTSVSVEAITTEITTVEPLNTTVGTCESNDTECIGVNVTTVSPSKNDTETNKTAQEDNKEELRHTIEMETNICTCNLQVDFCDINCCCDPDCSSSDKTIFGYCEMDKNRFYDTKYCNYIKYIYVNNTPLKWEINQDGLFCVISSNVPETYLIQKEDPINLTATVPLEKIFWHQEQDDIWESEPQFGSKNYGFGDSILMVRDNSTVEEFRLPKNFLTSPCIYKENVYYLKDVKNSCSQMTIDVDNLMLNFSSFFQKFKIIGSLKLFNVTKLKNIFKNCPKKICIEIEPKLCDVHFTNCSRLTDNSNVTFHCSYDFKKNLNTCQNAVEKIRYRFYHNGTDGIQRVQVLGVLKNFSYHFGGEDFQMLQDLSVEFLWINQVKNYSQMLSGNPGYMTGKPILAGIKINDGSTTILKRNLTDFLENFLALPANVKGMCVRNDTYNTPIEFEYNIIAKCELVEQLTIIGNKQNASDICKNIQKDIFDLWGLKNAYYNNSLVVGLFGNANSSNIKDWTPILYKTDPKTFLNGTRGNFTNKNTTLVCQNISTVLEVNVFYSRVDLKTILNQNKVLGVSFGFENVRNYSFSLDKANNNSYNLDLSLSLVSQVSFYDVTGEKTKKYVDPPSFDIRLPYDFFYPFIRVGNDVSLVKPNTVIFTLSLYWIFLF